MISLISLVFAGFFVIKPWLSDIAEKQGSTIDNHAELATLISKLEILNKQDPNTLKDYLIKLTLAVPQKSSPPIILATVEQAVNEAGLVIDNINFGGLSDVSQSTVSELGQDQSQQATNPINTASVSQSGAGEEIITGGKVDVQFSASGDYYQMVQFLNIVNRINPMILGVDFSVSLGSSSSTSSDGTLTQTAPTNTFSYSGIAPYQGLPTDLGGLTTDVQPLSGKEIDIIDELSTFSTYFEVKSEVEEIQSYKTGKDNPF
ncbi:hypothetical protein COX05_03755 [candidate division WWE3 bacterium CG22_combo_CG10-13_8_21_14_all_39_12]|uniref:Uncharacterized protein n=2 Tax=Katanobacteria TaxID=422282 RepID=A0A2M7X0C1_UNCKA|nr:MAG: hypothetical protein COX05_03755 [candidate division WWE3 bacterium CG22_combo_CG10-13_8_21_14_all_39_12]PJA39503.1 MAG: hypothetical protein CO179_05080 [candidate division WWE3 bacterium CG_4_9_14_3_um_filter_39_7]